MEYGQELDKIKTEVTNSGKKLEDLSKLLQNLSGLTKLQDSINNFQEDDALNRIETKIDILAQTDYSELFNFSVDNLKDALTKNNETLTQKINSIEESSIQSLNNLKDNLAENNETLTQKISSVVEESSIQSLNNLKDNLAENNETLTQKISSVVEESSIQSLNNLKDNLAENNETLTQKISSVVEESSLQSLNSLKDNLAENNETLTQKISSVVEESSLQSLNSLKDNLAENNETLTQKISSVVEESSIQSLNSLKDNLAENNETLTQKISSVVEESSIQSLNSLKDNLAENNETLTQKISSIEETINTFSDNSEKNILSNLSCLDVKITELSENISSSSQFEEFQESLNNLRGTIDLIKTDVESVANNPDAELIKSKINYISTKLNDYNQSAEEGIKDLAFLKENFYKINEKFSEITHLIRTNTSESEELNNRFESNITHFNSCFKNIYDQFSTIENTFNSNFTHFNSCFQNIYDQFSTIDNTFNNNFEHFKSCIQNVYDQFSVIDTRNDLDQIKLYVQSFNNKIISISEILEKFKENDFSIKIADQQEIQKLQNQIEKLDQNIYEFLDKFDKYNPAQINEKLDYIMNETQSFSNRISDEFTSLVNPLTSAIELTCGLKETIEDLLAQDDMQVKKEASELLDKFENIYKNAENNFEYIFTASKLFYEKLEEVKNDFCNISYDTNSKINDFVSKTDSIELKIQNNLSTSENALNSLKNISRFTETQINQTSESINLLKTGLSELSEEFNFFKNDINDISSKLNKLILNEKENSDAVVSSFEDLKEKINKTGEIIVKNLSPEFKDLNQKMDKAEEISSSTLETAKDVKSALVYMAEWFDSAGKLLEENNKNLKKNSIEIEKTDSSLKRTEENITEQIKRISDKLNRFEIRMENIEGKIERLNDHNSNREVLNLLSDILEKVEVANERSKTNELLISRLENIELKLEEIETQKTIKSKKRLVQEKI